MMRVVPSRGGCVRILVLLLLGVVCDVKVGSVLEDEDEEDDEEEDAFSL